MNRDLRIEQLADLLAIRLGAAPLDEMGCALAITLASVVAGYPHGERAGARTQFVALLDTRIQQLADAGIETTYPVEEET